MVCTLLLIVIVRVGQAVPLNGDRPTVLTTNAPITNTRGCMPPASTRSEKRTCWLRFLPGMRRTSTKAQPRATCSTFSFSEQSSVTVCAALIGTAFALLVGLTFWKQRHVSTHGEGKAAVSVPHIALTPITKLAVDDAQQHSPPVASPPTPGGTPAEVVKPAAPPAAPQDAPTLAPQRESSERAALMSIQETELRAEVQRAAQLYGETKAALRGENGEISTSREHLKDLKHIAQLRLLQSIARRSQSSGARSAPPDCCEFE
jgi:hypothetical protein